MKFRAEDFELQGLSLRKKPGDSALLKQHETNDNANHPSEPSINLSFKHCELGKYGAKKEANLMFEKELWITYNSYKTYKYIHTYIIIANHTCQSKTNESWSLAPVIDDGRPDFERIAASIGAWFGCTWQKTCSNGDQTQNFDKDLTKRGYPP